MLERSVSNPVVKSNILIVEDDNDLADLISMHLTLQGHQIERVDKIQEGKQQLSSQHYDLMILDRGLDDGDGMHLCHELRQNENWLPILMLTARDSEKDKVEGLEAGADDYLTKPFSVLEFQARVRAILRRRTHASSKEMQHQELTPNLEFKGLVIRPQSHQTEVNGSPVKLTATEFTLLHFLAQKPGRVYSKDDLLEQVWDTQFSGYHHTVCSTINRLRTKLESVQPSGSVHQYIHTVWGVGYKFEA